jgi:hypothetical protein
MEIEFDPAKDEANRRRHGVSLDLAAEMDFEVALVGWTSASPTEKSAGSPSARSGMRSTFWFSSTSAKTLSGRSAFAPQRSKR